ncbi:MAG TPA: hypothetical protein VL123_07230 [Candidatus Udaeobacter sp.]|nr:hypothetical protein [Candidatus Udaeobacter sp.]
MLAVLALAGCQSRPAQPTLPPLMRVEAREYGFVMPESVTAGLTRIRIVNLGTMWHESMAIQMVDSTRRAADYIAAFPTIDFPPFGRDLGGPGLTVPGDSGEVWLDLTPGHHILACFFNDHLEKHGMAADFVVTPATGPPVARPRADIEMHFRDNTYALSRPFRRGHQLVHIVNDGPQPHEGDLVRLEPGRTWGDFRRWMKGHYVGPSPGRAGGGTGDLYAGREMWLVMDLEPGNYVMYCTVPDTVLHKDHYDLGMTHEFRIE